MADLKIGQHCGVSTCHQLDFLPITCSSCSQTFCKEHAALDAHSCSMEFAPKASGVYTGPHAHDCNFEGCKQRELTPVTCPECSKNFCLQHRHQVDHNCEKLEEPKEKMPLTKQLVQNIKDSKPQKVKKKPLSKKAKAMAAKVALMKMKMKAVGDKGIPEPEKVYLGVCLPASCSKKSAPMYFSKVWTIGKLIDKISNVQGVKNENNVPGAKRLYLFDSEGKILPTQTSLADLLTMEDGLLNGSTVILEYLPDGETSLENAEDYSYGV